MKPYASKVLTLNRLFQEANDRNKRSNSDLKVVQREEKNQTSRSKKVNKDLPIHNRSLSSTGDYHYSTFDKT